MDSQATLRRDDHGQRQLVVDPTAFRQFGDASSAFFLVTDDELAKDFSLADSRYQKAQIVSARRGSDLGGLIAELPDDAAVLVAAPGSFVRSADLLDIGGRRVAVLPCGSTPVRPDHLRYFLDVTARTDPEAQAAHAQGFFDALDESKELTLADDIRHTECTFDVTDDSYVWNQQAGVLEPGDQQIAPAGELSVMPMDIVDFDPTRRLALNGTLAIRGEPIVHAGYMAGLDDSQAELYGRLNELRRHPVVLAVENGLITDCRPTGAEAARAAATLLGLFQSDPRYRVIWELGFGINTVMNVVTANCGLNEVYGGTRGVVHLGIGLTPFTRFALTFLCLGTRLIDGNEATFFGARRQITRTRTASCGCQ